ncbi:MAG TPA: hypothetical protein VHX86_01570 [Tepidisphaeraceae bacterium]|nr:hypothetical protein [Tepidisphaeraceae bacterium]
MAATKPLLAVDMHTVVFQSFRTHDVPAWIDRCMKTVRDWAAARGFDYRFIDDRFFDCVPEKYRAKTTDKIMLSDLARLMMSKQLLGEGYQRTVWVDGDVVVFAPDSWELPTDHDYYFCYEIMPVNRSSAGFRFDVRANNAVSIFSAGNPFQDFYIHACEQIMDGNANPEHWALGTYFLSWLRRAFPLPLLHNVGTFGPRVLKDLAHGTTDVLPLYVRATNVPLVAANCCVSMRDKLVTSPIEITDDLCTAAIDRCIESGGEVVNRYLRSIS